MGTVKYSGPVASFHCPTNADIRSLKVHFSPKQLGEGTPSPENVRPIEGWDGVAALKSGKNLFDTSKLSCSHPSSTWSASTETNDMVFSNGELSGIVQEKWRDTTVFSQNIPFQPGTYTLSFDYINGIKNYKWKPVIISATYSGWYTSYKGSIVADSDSGHKELTFTADKPFYVALNLNSFDYAATTARNKLYNIQLELGSTATPYEPYHGSTTNYEFGVLGKNKFDNLQSPFKSGQYVLYDSTVGKEPVYTTNANYNVYSIPIIKNTTYTISGIKADNPCSGLIDNQGIFTYVRRNNGSTGGTSWSITTGENDEYLLLSVAINGTYKCDDILQLELGSTPTSYEPYNPNKTVYGGWVDLISGEVVKTWAVRPISQMSVTKTNGTGVWQHRFDLRAPWITGVGYEDAGGTYKAICSIFSFGTAETNFTYRTYAGLIDVYDDTTETAEDFKTKYGDYTVAYNIRSELYEHYQLPPNSTELKTFLSQNNVWSNADYVEVEYDLHETRNILARKQFIIANQPHVEKLAAAPLQNFKTDMAAPLKECKVHFGPIQEGSGDPSPDNVRAISGWNSIQVGLPSEYQRVEYLESSGTQNINLGKALNVDDYCFYFKLMPLTLGGNSASNNYAGIMGQNAAPQVGWFQGGWCVGNSGSANPFLPEIGQIYELEYSKDFYGNYCVNGQETGLRRRGNMLCRLFYVENKSNNAIARLYSAYAVDKSNKYVYNLIPCVRKSDSKPGMYDTVTKTFYTNAGTGEFVCGPDVEEQSLSVDWTDEAGTIYGGYLDLVKGEVVEEWHKIVADGINVKANRGNYKSDILQSYGGAIVYLNPIGEGKDSNAFCDNLLLNSMTTIPTIHTFARGQMYAVFYLFPYSNYEEEPTATDIMNATNAWLQEHPTTIVYKLRNPIHHSLTPTQLKTLRGTNNIWSNANNNIELSYWKH